MILDIEATSLHPIHSYPIEIGWLRANGEVVSYLVDLTPVVDDVEWTSCAEEMHGITLDECLTNGKPAQYIVEQLLGDFGDQPPYCDGPHYDYRWLTRLFDMAGVKCPYGQLLDVTDLYIKALTLNGFTLKDASAQAEMILEKIVDPQRFHRAEDDVRALMQGLEIAKVMTPTGPLPAQKTRQKPEQAPSPTPG